MRGTETQCADDADRVGDEIRAGVRRSATLVSFRIATIVKTSSRASAAIASAERSSMPPL
jgi:hypothetical protein